MTDTSEYDDPSLGGDDGGSSGASTSTSTATAPVAIELSVPLVVQHDQTTCWAASVAMVAGARDGTTYTVDDVAGPPPHHGKNWPAIEPVALEWGMREIAPADWMPQGWADLLYQSGPLWIVIKGNPTYHAVVLGGINGDGSLEGTEVTLYNPEGYVDCRSFNDFCNTWDLGANANAMILAGR